MSSLKIGTAVANSGQKAEGFVIVGENDQLGFARGQIRIPVLIANGASPGPRLVLTAGQHSGEYIGTEAAIRLVDGLDPAALQGTVIAFPVLNIYGFLEKVPYVCPYDGLNMNRLWPGDHGGTIGQRIVHALWESAILTADTVIDMHGGDFPESQSDYAIFFATADAVSTTESERLARLFGFKYVRRSSEEEGGRETGSLARIFAEKTRKPAVVTEVGDSGCVDAERLNSNMTGLTNVMKGLGMLAGDASPMRGDQLVMMSRTAVVAGAAGLCRLHVRIDQSVERGQCIATVCDLHGHALEELVSPVDGAVVQLFRQAATSPGHIVAKVASLAPCTSMEGRN